jgi:hypothetical protein
MSYPVAVAIEEHDPPGRRLRLDRHDRAPWLTGLVGLGLVGALYLRAFGLPGTDLHGPLHRIGVMDPFCGGTRATYLLVRGDLVGAWSWNPLVPLLAIGSAALIARLVVGLATHRWVTVSLPRRAWLASMTALLVVIEVNQQLQADRLINVVPA